MSQPYLEGVWGWNSHSRNWDLGVLWDSRKFQSSIVRVKTPHIGVFFMSFENYRNVNVKNGLTWAIWTSTAQVMAKKRVGVKLAIWFPTTKSREPTWPRCVQLECDTPLKSYRGELQVCFRPHPNRRSEQRVWPRKIMGLQIGTVLGLLFGSPETKSHLDVSAAEKHRV
jgi:hypothetical protein